MLSHIAIKIHCLISRCSFPLSFFLSLKFMSILRGLILSSLLSYCISCLLKRSGLVSLGFSIHTDNQSRSHLNSHHATACVPRAACRSRPALSVPCYRCHMFVFMSAVQPVTTSALCSRSCGEWWQLGQLCFLCACIVATSVDGQSSVCLVPPVSSSWIPLHIPCGASLPDFVWTYLPIFFISDKYSLLGRELRVNSFGGLKNYYGFWSLITWKCHSLVLRCT